ncbi:carbamoyl-phosphate synthase [Synechococcus sp. MIT S9503]|uniref:carbamoyl-phosphate synthase n=1 Tax=Synechococcus sp. MIT S9503 TaxID=3082547 RepID=UPI0039A67ED6
MLRRLSIGLLASAVAIAPLPLKAQDGSAEDLGDVMSISLKDVVKSTFGFQGALQGAGTPNQAGIGGFLPLSVGDNSVWFVDALINANFADREGDSSIINTDVAGTTVSTSTRVGYRWLNSDRSWMYGLNAGYDSRPMNSGGTDTGINVSGTEKSAFFQQIAVNAEAVSIDWNFNAYALIPIGDTEQKLNRYYQGGALDTYGLDIGYFITPELNASVGYYYQHGDLGAADGSGVLGRLAYEISSGLTAGVNISYDEAFETRVSADLKVRFGGASTTAQRNEVQQQPVINALTSKPSNRDVRVHDCVKTPFLVTCSPEEYEALEKQIKSLEADRRYLICRDRDDRLGERRHCGETNDELFSEIEP